jgi:hypothetical protein
MHIFFYFDNLFWGITLHKEVDYLITNFTSKLVMKTSIVVSMEKSSTQSIKKSNYCVLFIMLSALEMGHMNQENYSVIICNDIITLRQTKKSRVGTLIEHYDEKCCSLCAVKLVKNIYHFELFV